MISKIWPLQIQQFCVALKLLGVVFYQPEKWLILLKVLEKRAFDTL